ncbi:helix-turn-helix transcriptional regulator [Ideonella sp.]|uniref:helix-turn-helix transcriptional regulator n=1 Tax=Ideonella sp. TaxID=1929293 RepID=UPI0035AFB68D
MRASRLLSIQMLLETRGRMSARALADALEISVRTLYRDVDELTAAGVPVYAERGRAGGFELMRGWKTTLTGLTPSEAQAVFLSGLAGPAAELGLGDHVEQAQLKLLAALPASWRDDARRVSSRLYLDPIDWYRESQPLPHLATVATAVWDERPLAMHYESWKLTSRRTIHPLGLVLKAGAWYLVAASDDKLRTYRVASILDAELQPGVVKRPKGFNLTEYWRQSVQRFEAEVFKGEATVRATATGLKSLSYLSAAVAKAVAAVNPPEGDGERVELRIPIETIDHATGQLLRLAPEVEVLGPPALKRATIERLRRIVALYGL